VEWEVHKVLGDRPLEVLPEEEKARAVVSMPMLLLIKMEELEISRL
jgi:hypothetical protein